MSALTVTLSHAKNPDICGGYWSEPADSGRARKVPVASIAEASRVCEEYRERNQLGGGNWTAGDVREGKKLVARISYNGRAWRPDGTEIVIESEVAL